MARPRLRIFSVLLISAAAACCAWWFIPSSPVDRALLRLVASSTANPPFIIAGNGTQASPWSLRVLAPHRKADPGKAPLVVSITDDPEGIFQSSPPSAVDVAIILKNARRLGASSAAISAILAWEDPETIALGALDSELAAFGKIVTAAPLSRGVTSSPLPPSFRKSSIPLDRIRGDTTSIPAANRISLPGVILGGESAISGFSILENEPEGVPLLARWEDRIVFAFPLAAVIAENDLPPEDIEIDLGNYIKLSPAGPFIPIDSSGRLAISPGKTPSPADPIPAVRLIDATEPLPLSAGKSLLIRDDQSSSEAETRAFSAGVSPLIAAIASGSGMSEEQTLRRPPPASEIGMIGAVILVLAALSARDRFSRNISFLILSGILVSAHFITASAASIWLPTLPVTTAILVAFATLQIFFRDPLPAIATGINIEKPPSSPLPDPPAPAPGPPQEETPPPVIPAPPSQPISEKKTKSPKKAATKKTAAKKATAKKTAAAKKTPAKKSPAAKKTAAKKTTRKRPPGPNS